MSASSKHPEEILAELGLRLPEPPTPRANYLKAVRSGNLVFVAGHGPMVDDRHSFLGKLGKEGEERGMHARSAVGMATLPFGISVEIESIFEVR